MEADLADSPTRATGAPILHRPSLCRLDGPHMTHQQMADDIIDYRMGRIDKGELRKRFRSWQVDPLRAKWEVEQADSAGPPRVK